MKCLFFFCFAISFVFLSCSKEMWKHGIKGRIIYKATGLPFAHQYVEIGYYTRSSGMGILTLNGKMGSGYTDANGNFDISFPVKKYHLSEGNFTIKVAYRGILYHAAEVDHSEFRHRRKVTVPTIALD